MDILDLVPWIACIFVAGSLVFAIVNTVREGPNGVKYVIFCGLLLVGGFILVAAALNIGDMVSYLLRQINIYLEEKQADAIGLIVVAVWGIAMYLFIKRNK